MLFTLRGTASTHLET